MLFGSIALMAQSSECPTVGNPPDMYYNIFQSKSTGEPAPVYVKLYFHVFQEDDGSGGLTASDIETAKSNLNAAYNPHGIYFVYHCDIDFIKNSYLYKYGLDEVNYHLPNSCAVWNTNHQIDGINIYFISPHNYANVAGTFGVAENIPSKNCIIGYAYDGVDGGASAALTSTLVHEVGHCLGMLHTHAGSGNNPKGPCPLKPDYFYDCEGNFHLIEYIAAEDSDNCHTAGDKICDTPPDHYKFGDLPSKCQIENNYPKVFLKDACPGLIECYADQGIGFTAQDWADTLANPFKIEILTPECQKYNPDLTNYMTTGKTRSCRDHFTTQQGMVMKNFINTHPVLASVRRTADDYANATNCPCSSQDIHIYDQQSYAADQIINGNVYIHAGGNLTITAKIQFPEGKGIIVERGGKLKVTGPNAKLTAACNYQWWNGIEVEGNNQKEQPDGYLSATTSDDAGIVLVESNATIEKAKVAISTRRHGEYWNEAYWGGLVQLKDCYFKGNRKAVEFMRYRIDLNGTNKSYITNVEFDGEMPNSTTSEGVTIWSTDGIQYERNLNRNFDRAGLTIVDGWIKVVNNCDFQDSNRGISSYATAPLNSSLEIGELNTDYRNYFTNNQIAIESYGADGLNSGSLNVFNNQIDNCSIGILLEGDNKHKIFYNRIVNTTLGIPVANSGDFENKIQCNDISNSQVGILYRGNNSLSQFKYNNFAFTSGPEVLLYSFTGTPTSVRNIQGAAGDPAENCFKQGGASNQIYTLGNTAHFTYLVDTVQAHNYCITGGPIPNCNLTDGCLTPNNYTLQHEPNKKEQDEDCATLSTQGGTIYTILDFYRFDSLHYIYSSACSGLPAVCVQAEEYAGLRGQAMRDVTRSYLEANNRIAADSFLLSAGTEDARIMLYGLYFRERDWTSAAGMLSTLSEETEAQRQFVATQRIALEYAMNPSNLYLSAYKDSLLHAIAADEWPAAAYAKSLLYLIKGESFNFIPPVLPRESSWRESDKNSSAANLVNVFPNPANNEITVVADNGSILSEIQVYTLQGKSIRKIVCNSNKGLVNTSQLSDGLYIIKVLLEGNISATKLIQVIH